MLERDAGRKAHRTFAASSEIETGLSQSNDPQQVRDSFGPSYGSRLNFASPGSKSGEPLLNLNKPRRNVDGQK
jgi:hypothetical protein